MTQRKQNAEVLAWDGLNTGCYRASPVTFSQLSSLSSLLLFNEHSSISAAEANTFYQQDTVGSAAASMEVEDEDELVRMG